MNNNNIDKIFKNNLYKFTNKLLFDLDLLIRTDVADELIISNEYTKLKELATAIDNILC
jgi:hypothetical protein